MGRKLLLIVAIPFLACQQVKTKLGIGDKVTNPEPGTPEAVVQEVLRAALDPNEQAGWERFASLLHSSELDSPAAMNDWRNTKFPAIRRKAAYYVQDRNTVSFTIMDRREEPPSLSIFVKSSATDMPTPCKLRQDPAAGNAWRVFNACF